MPSPVELNSSRRPARPGAAAALVGVAVALLTAASGSPAYAQAPAPTRFAVVDISAERAPIALTDEVAQEVQRLRPGWQPIEDTDLARLLATGEGPTDRAQRERAAARAAQAAGDCVGALDHADRALALTLAHVSIEDEREALRELLTMQIVCADQLGRADDRATAAARLGALVATPPDDLPRSLWDAHVARPNATPAPEVEVQIDSEPPNARIVVDFRGRGTTPRTVKLPPGPTDIELQKDGFHKAYRRVTIGPATTRVVVRLLDRAHDKPAQAGEAVRSLRKNGIGQTAALARLAQLTRADTLVLVDAGATEVTIAFFDAERGAVAKEAIVSPYDRDTGRVAALATRATPAESVGVQQPGVLAPIGPDGRPLLPTGTGASTAAKPAGLPETAALTETEKPPPRAAHEGYLPPWWAWVIAGAVAAGVGIGVWLDQPKRRDTLTVSGRWSDPGP